MMSKVLTTRTWVDQSKVRDRILKEHRKVVLSIRSIEQNIENVLKRSQSVDSALEKERSAQLVQLNDYLQQYYQWLPPVLLSRCPFCLADLFRRFDPIDLCGFWWMDRTQRPIEEPAHCAHFGFLSGALNLNGHPVQGGLYEAQPGPDTPFVIKRILQEKDIVAVISAIEMSCGYTAYPIAYFSLGHNSNSHYSQTWARKEFYLKQNQQIGWRELSDDFDFDLSEWICRDKLRFFTNNRFLTEQEALDILPLLNPDAKLKPQSITNHTLQYLS